MIYKAQEDIVKQYSEDEYELEDRISIYYFDNIDLTIFYSDRYKEWFKEDHYDLMPVNMNKFQQAELDEQEMKGILKLII